MTPEEAVACIPDHHTDAREVLRRRLRFLEDSLHETNRLKLIAIDEKYQQEERATAAEAKLQSSRPNARGDASHIHPMTTRTSAAARATGLGANCDFCAWRPLFSPS